MNLFTTILRFLQTTKEIDLPLFYPEVCLVVGLVGILFFQLFRYVKEISPFLLMAGVFFIAGLFSCFGLETQHRTEIFSGLLVVDSFTCFFRFLFSLTGFFLSLLLYLNNPVSSKSAEADIAVLLLGATLGTFLMVSTNHLLMIFLSIEMASIPSYLLVSLRRSQKRTSEGSLKYAVYGAVASGILLYGLSLLFGLFKTAHLPTMANEIIRLFPAMEQAEIMLFSIAGLMVIVGLAFKVSAFPFHFWCPDVFESASSEVNLFLSISSKGAALALFIRLIAPFGIFETSPEILNQIRYFLSVVLAVLGVLTVTFGNLAAYGQTSLKRLMAYSTIAHAGLLLLPLIVLLTALDISSKELAVGAVSSLLIYLGIYLFLNLGMFAFTAAVCDNNESANIHDNLSGLIYRQPTIAISIVLILFGLIGIPPLSGFVAKFAIFAALTSGYLASGNILFLFLLLVGGINTVISLGYYLYLIKIIVWTPSTTRPTVTHTLTPATPQTETIGTYSTQQYHSNFSRGLTALVTLCGSSTLILFLFWDTIYTVCLRAAHSLF
ncbi:MAG: NADH-quinone oxidoreductase subunit N [Pirellulaceae bacterium]|nr:NADH-quinone oxidoreductase subunit N [Pirellulaceae bacterium]